MRLCLVNLLFVVFCYGTVSAQDDLYRGVPWIPTYDPLYSAKRPVDRLDKEMDNSISDDDETSIKSIQKEKKKIEKAVETKLKDLPRPKSHKVPKDKIKTQFDKYADFIPPRPVGPPPEVARRSQLHWGAKKRRGKRSPQGSESNVTAPVASSSPVNRVLQGITSLFKTGMAYYLSGQNFVKPSSRAEPTIQDSVQSIRQNLQRRTANLIKTIQKQLQLDDIKLFEQFTERAAGDQTNLLRDIGVAVLTQGLGWIGWVGLVTASNANHPFGKRSFLSQNIVKRIGDALSNETPENLDSFKNQLENALVDNFSERQLSVQNSNILRDVGLFSLVQVVGWSAWAGLAAISNPSTPLLAGRKFAIQDDFERVKGRLFEAFTDNIGRVYPELQKIVNF